MTIFRSRGFDTLIGKGTSIRGSIVIAANSTTVIDGDAFLDDITGVQVEGKVSKKTTLRVGGTLRPKQNEGLGVFTPLNINVDNVIITGNVECDTIRVEGTLAVKAGATLKAKKILYRNLVAETGSVIHGAMSHLDHVSEGELV